MDKIYIVVEGGLIQSVYAKDNAEVIIIDHDVQEEEEIVENEELVKLLDEDIKDLVVKFIY